LKKKERAWLRNSGLQGPYVPAEWRQRNPCQIVAVFAAHFGSFWGFCSFKGARKGRDCLRNQNVLKIRSGNLIFLKKN
jgi:hypothetical protein